MSSQNEIAHTVSFFTVLTPVDPFRKERRKKQMEREQKALIAAKARYEDNRLRMEANANKIKNHHNALSKSAHKSPLQNMKKGNANKLMRMALVKRVLENATGRVVSVNGY